MIELRARSGDAVVEVEPDHGGRVGQITIDGTAILVGHRPDLPPLGWGWYPMVPWAGRVRDGTFTFDGTTFELPRTMRPHAIHGTGWLQRWSVDDDGDEHVAMSCTLDWPLGGGATHVIHVEPDRVVATLSVRAGDRAMPAVIGWHPWFVKPDRLDVSFAAMYVRDAEGITLDELVSPRPRPWDDCFVRPAHPPEVRIGDLSVVVDSDCDHWVVYDELPGATCVEPQSGPPDAFNMAGRATRLAPGEELRRTMQIRWESPDRAT